MSISGFPLSSHLPEDLGLGERFWYWRGASGRKYIHSIYPADACPPLPGAVYVAVRHDALGREAVAVGRFPGYWDGALDARALLAEIAAEADEVHVHLLARDDGAADAVMQDLQRADRPSLCTPPAYAGFQEATPPALTFA